MRRTLWTCAVVGVFVGVYVLSVAATTVGCMWAADDDRLEGV